jgi:3-oxoacyl-[acyl-carrier protein] reductase
MTERWFEGRMALVTGGARGIGRATSELLARRGARVAGNYRTRERDAEEAVARITAAGGVAIPLRADVSDP